MGDGGWRRKGGRVPGPPGPFCRALPAHPSWAGAPLTCDAADGLEVLYSPLLGPPQQGPWVQASPLLPAHPVLCSTHGSWLWRGLAVVHRGREPASTACVGGCVPRGVCTRNQLGLWISWPSVHPPRIPPQPRPASPVQRLWGMAAWALAAAWSPPAARSSRPQQPQSWISGYHPQTLVVALPPGPPAPTGGEGKPAKPSESRAAQARTLLTRPTRLACPASARGWRRLAGGLMAV